jgi:hypothetical protein
VRRRRGAARAARLSCTLCASPTLFFLARMMLTRAHGRAFHFGTPRAAAHRWRHVGRVAAGAVPCAPGVRPRRSGALVDECGALLRRAGSVAGGLAALPRPRRELIRASTRLLSSSVRPPCR